MSESEKPEEPRIIVDDDWKEQVAKEKAGITADPEPDDVSAAESRADESRADESRAGKLGADEPSAAEEPVADNIAGKSGLDSDYPPPPPASFDMLISMLFTQAMAMLGQVPDPSMEAQPINKPYAKHYIDTLEMLGEKTKGNLGGDEAKMLSEALHALRMAYVNVKA